VSLTLFQKAGDWGHRPRGWEGWEIREILMMVGKECIKEV
jgi:hypothetical protein